MGYETTFITPEQAFDTWRRLLDATIPLLIGNPATRIEDYMSPNDLKALVSPNVEVKARAINKAIVRAYWAFVVEKPLDATANFIERLQKRHAPAGGRATRYRRAARTGSIVVASTTSTQDSGLFGYLLPIVKEKTGIVVKVLAQGTGQALDTARRGNADVVFVHAKSAEKKFLAEGFGVKRYPVMYNDFIVVGPKDDPAGVTGKDILTALQTIKTKGAPFISRGDRSGTNIAELALWKDAGIDISSDRGTWYKEIDQGMGTALNVASAANAYVLSDRGTWLAFQNKGDLAILVEGDKRLFNEYGVMLVNPAKCPSVKKDLGQQFIDWLISSEGQKVIAGYKINGRRLFYPNASVYRPKSHFSGERSLLA
jgi:tungstate transport system substrate-binding protein